MPDRRPITCARCGYRCDPSWRYCAGCGWDLRVLVGDAAQTRLIELTRAVVGLTIIKQNRGLQDYLAPRDYRRIARYFNSYVGQHKDFATAFPFHAPGFFVTSARAVQDAEAIEIRTAENLQYPAEIVASDPASGIGLIKATLPGSRPLPAAADPIGPSQDAYVVCYPIHRDDWLVQYLPVSLHRGLVTASGESGTYLVPLENLLRSDHTLPQGCRGGAVIDLRGALAGMILGGPDTGITYALPIADIAAVAGPLSRGSLPDHPYFGMALVAADERRRARFGITETPPHPLVAYLIPGSPAERAGVRPGDFLAAVDGDGVATVAAAGLRLLRARPGGRAVALSLLRGAQETTLGVTPESRPARILLDPVEEFMESMEINLVPVDTGPTTQQGLRVANLVRGGRGDEEEYKDGDVITAIEGKGARRLETFSAIVRNGNAHVFDGGGKSAKDAGTAREFNVYFLDIDIRTAAGEKEQRGYMNLFPDVLAPPVY